MIPDLIPTSTTTLLYPNRTVLSLVLSSCSRITIYIQYKAGQHKIYDIDGIKLSSEHPISVIKISCPNRIFLEEVKVFNPKIHDQSESFIINHWFPGQTKSSITAQYSKVMLQEFGENHWYPRVLCALARRNQIRMPVRLLRL